MNLYYLTLNRKKDIMTFLYLFKILLNIYINRAPNDTSNFAAYPDSDSPAAALKPADDPFLGKYY